MSNAPVIVGAGPAGVRAAQTLVAHGLRPLLIDEAARCGGQIFRQPPASLARSAADVYGPDAAAAQALHQSFARIAAEIDYRPNTLVWNIEGRRLDLLLSGSQSTLQSVEHDGLIIASGATDRVLPFAGWTLPGVFTLGAAQIALKFQRCTIGPRVVLAGTGPLLYLVAWQYAKAGATIAAVLDEATTADQVAAAPALLREPRMLMRGLRFRAVLLARGIPVRQGARLRRAIGAERVEAVEWSARDDANTQRIHCDAIAFGYHLRPETQLADLADCRFEFEPLQRAWLPSGDTAGRTSVNSVYLAGDGAGIRGAEAAELAGERAALALLADRGHAIDAARVEELERRLAAKDSWRRGLARAFPFPADWAAQVPDDLEICRCEHVTAGDLRQSRHECGADELNRLKALTRVGMGRCQARMCGTAAAEILAHAAGKPIADVGRVRGLAPIKPLPFAAIDSVKAEAR